MPQVIAPGVFIMGIVLLKDRPDGSKEPGGGDSVEKEKKKFSVGLIVKSHHTTRKADKDPKFKVVMKSKNEKITLNLELPDMGRQIFQLYPLGEIVEASLGEPSQLSLEAFKDSEED